MEKICICQKFVAWDDHAIMWVVIIKIQEMQKREEKAGGQEQQKKKIFAWPPIFNCHSYTLMFHFVEKLSVQWEIDEKQRNNN